MPLLPCATCNQPTVGWLFHYQWYCLAHYRQAIAVFEAATK